MLPVQCLTFTTFDYSEKIVSVKFMKKYIHIAKSVKPVLTQAASDAIAEHYAKLRSYEKDQDDLARVCSVRYLGAEFLYCSTTLYIYLDCAFNCHIKL